MKYKKMRCLTRSPVTDDVKPCYRWRNYDQTEIGFTFYVYEHRVLFFLTLHAHLIIEETLENLTRILLPQLFSKITLLFYDVIHGLICAYNMKDILDFWRTR